MQPYAVMESLAGLGRGTMMVLIWARGAIGVVTAAGLIVMLSAWPVHAQEGDGEAPREEPRFDVFWGGGVSFVRISGYPSRSTPG